MKPKQKFFSIAILMAILVSSFTINAQNTFLNLKVYLQGYYVSNGLMKPVWQNQGRTGNENDVDSITVQLRDISSPFTVVATAQGMLKTNGTVSLELQPLSKTYYIVVRHRNTLETWSKYTVAFTPGNTTIYDFTTETGKAFASNMVEVENGIWALYTGDLNDDENIDLVDYLLWETDYNNFASGYFSSDLNGDGNVDLFDYSLWETNNNNFITCIKPTTTDIPGISICDQIWMAKNLDVTRYRNGDLIPQVTDPTAWSTLTTGAWCWYNNDSTTYASTYGKLYNWYAVNDSRGLAPLGWHVPSKSEWLSLLNTCLSGLLVAGGKIKEIGTSHWISPNSGATNSSGFTSLPAGRRYNINGLFYSIGTSAFFWSSTENNISTAWVFYMPYDGDNVYVTDTSCSNGYSVRCVKD